MWTALISPIAGLVSQWFENKKEESKAKHEHKVKQLTGEIELDNTSAGDMRHSWKDEWLVLVFTTPIVAIFYGSVANDPEIIKRMVDGIKAISNLPVWYQTTLGAITVASFGLRTYKQYKGN